MFLEASCYEDKQNKGSSKESYLYLSKSCEKDPEKLMKEFPQLNCYGRQRDNEGKKNLTWGMVLEASCYEDQQFVGSSKESYLYLSKSCEKDPENIMNTSPQLPTILEFDHEFCYWKGIRVVNLLLFLGKLGIH